MAHPIDEMKRHFLDMGVQSVEVPEWGEPGGKPLVIRWKPMTLAEKQRLLNIGEREGVIARLADTIIMKALDEQGKPLFTIDHKHALRHLVDPDLLAYVVGRMVSVPTVADMGKASSGTTTSD